MAAGPAVFAAVLNWLLNAYPEHFPAGSVPSDREFSLFSTFSWVIGFILVFRTSQSYGRYWEGAQLLHAVTTEWYDACAQIIGFAASSHRDEEEMRAFTGTTIRLFSILHCSALQQVTVMDDDRFHVIDAKGLDKELRRFLRSYDLTGTQEERRQKTEIIFQWITRFVLEAINYGTISTPAPIVTRAFQELNSGMTALNRMMTITDTPFPFPYVQMITTLLLIYMIFTPFIIAPQASHWFWAGFFTFVAVFTQWAINLIASEIEQPFGDDLNDFNLWEVQDEMNSSLLLLCEPSTQAVPKALPLVGKATHRLSVSQYQDIDPMSGGFGKGLHPDLMSGGTLGGSPSGGPAAPASGMGRGRWHKPRMSALPKLPDIRDSDDDNSETKSDTFGPKGAGGMFSMLGKTEVSKKKSSASNSDDLSVLKKKSARPGDRARTSSLPSAVVPQKSVGADVVGVKSMGVTHSKTLSIPHMGSENDLEDAPEGISSQSFKIPAMGAKARDSTASDESAEDDEPVSSEPDMPAAIQPISSQEDNEVETTMSGTTPIRSGDKGVKDKFMLSGTQGDSASTSREMSTALVPNKVELPVAKNLSDKLDPSQMQAQEFQEYQMYQEFSEFQEWLNWRRQQQYRVGSNQGVAGTSDEPFRQRHDRNLAPLSSAPLQRTWPQTPHSPAKSSMPLDLSKPPQLPVHQGYAPPDPHPQGDPFRSESRASIEVVPLMRPMSRANREYVHPHPHHPASGSGDAPTSADNLSQSPRHDGSQLA
eukprot:gnl/MRDRNA2_/MRDRNA2_69072_c0_seq1.p1 gnl/MRDRNA2_/MRDRNA2_69072_c0~~gnl/MRDRNA2_/MRDRNA2_69072_c0_seq1.p1  ORF type:complete len:833 (+),score=111.01 gnl/MRDRNA2_/MRDRNA2_69072_c0_seq1:215-2500(+)